MKSFKKIVSIILLVSMIFTSNAFYTLAEGNSQNDVQVTIETTTENSIEEEQEDESTVESEEESEEAEKTSEEESTEEESTEEEETTSEEDTTTVEESTQVEDATEKEETTATEETTSEEETTKEEESTTAEATTVAEETTTIEKATEETTTTKVEETTVVNTTVEESTPSEATTDVEEEKELVATASQADEEVKDILSSIYPSYEGILSYENGKVKLNKDLTLESSLVFNSLENIIFDLNGHELIAPKTGFAFDIKNSKVTIKDSQFSAIVKAQNGDSTLVYAENSDVTFTGANMYAAEDCSVLDYKDSNITIVASTFVAGDATGVNAGPTAIVGNLTNDEYKITIAYSKIYGGKGSYDKDLSDVQAIGGKSLLVNGESVGIISLNKKLEDGISGDFGGTNGGSAIELNGSIDKNNIDIQTTSYVIGGDGGSKGISKKAYKKSNNKFNDEYKPSIFGATNYDDNIATDEEIKDTISLSSYKTDDKYVTSLKNQSGTPWCYTFAHIAMAETYMLKHYWDYCQEHLVNGEFNLSEVALAYFFRNNAEDPLGNASSSKDTNELYDGWENSPVTDYATFLNSTSQFRGLCSEEAAEFPNDIDNEEKIKSNQFNDIVNLTDYELEGFNEQPMWPDYGREGYIEKIKSIVARDGSVVLETPWFPEAVKEYGTDGKYNTFVYKDAFTPMYGDYGNHTLQIIGWDDNFSKDNFVAQEIYNNYQKDKQGYINRYVKDVEKAFGCFGMFQEEGDSAKYTEHLLNALQVSMDGAFLCKNSHGVYTWLSYTNCRMSNILYSASFIPADKYDNLYYYDSGTSPYIQKVKAVKTKFYAKKDNEKIMGVTWSSFDKTGSVDITVRAEKTDKDGVVHDDYEERVVRKGIVSSHCGNNYVTFDRFCDEVIVLKKGQEFSIEINPYHASGTNMFFAKSGKIAAINRQGAENLPCTSTYTMTSSGNSYIKPNSGAGWEVFDGDARVHIITNNITDDDVWFFADQGDGYINHLDYEGRRHRLKGDTIIPNPEQFYKIGFHFHHWEDQDGNTYEAEEPITITKNTTVKPIYEENEYTLELVDGGATYRSGYTAPNNYVFKHFEKVYLPTAKDMSKEGYIFDGWYESSDFAGGYKFIAVDGGKSYTDSGKYGNPYTKFYAKWDKVSESGKIYHKVTFKANGGSGVMSEQYVEKNVWTPIKLNEFVAPGTDRNGNRDFRFMEWRDDLEYHYQDGQNIRTDRDVVLTALWAPRNGKAEESVISFIAPGIQSHMLEQRVTKEDKRIQLNNVTLKREGYEFAYWVEVGDNGELTQIDNRGYINASTNHVLYARWKKDGVLVNEPLGIPGNQPDTLVPSTEINETDEYSLVTFKPNGANGQAYTQKVTVKGTKLKPVEFTRDGYVFIEWEEEGKLNAYTKRTWKDQQSFNDDSVTLLAVWMKQEDYDSMYEKMFEYGITHGYDEGEIPKYEITWYRYNDVKQKEYPRTVLLNGGERFFLHQNDKKEGYKFSHFEDQYGKKYEDDSFIYADDDYVLKAFWNEVGSQEEDDTEETDPTISTSASGGGTDDKPEDTIATEEETTAPEETKTVTITFSGGEAGGEQYTQVIDKDVSTALNPVTFTREGYTFSHWLDDLGNKIKDKDPVIYSDDMLLVAIWDEIVYTPIPINADPVYVRGGRGGSGGGGGGGGGSALPSNNQSLQNNTAMPTALAQNNNLQQQQQQQQTNVHTVPPTVTNGADSTVKGQVQVNDAGVNWVFNPTDGSWSLNNKGQVLKDGFYNLTKASNNLFNNTVTQQVYCFDKNGKMVTGWVNDTKGNTYFFENTPNSAAQGTMLVGAQNIQGSVYYFDPASGQMAKNMNIGGYIFGADGKLTNPH